MGYLSLLQRTSRDYHGDPFPYSLLTTRECSTITVREPSTDVAALRTSQNASQQALQKKAGS